MSNEFGSPRMKRQDGYVADVSYPPHFHKEMQPVWLASVAYLLGTAAPDITRPYTYCELGCGLGINLLVAAATNPLGQFVGVDFNARHLAVAEEAAGALGLGNLRFVHADFARFERDNEQPFDFIASHGAWSWIAPAQQQHVLRLVERSLKPGGLFYLHYMCHPGATQMIPVQKLLNELAPDVAGDSEGQVQAGIELLCRLDAAGVFVDQPRLSASLRTLRQANPAYLAHHFLSDHWAPQHSVDLHRAVARGGVAYLGSANVFESLDSLSIPGAAQPLLAGLPSPALREAVKDLARNQHQRQDLFQRTPEALAAPEHRRRVGAMRFCLGPQTPGTGGLSFATPIGEIQGPAAIFSPLLDRLAQAPASFDELSTLPAFFDNPGLLSQSLQMLMWQGSVHPLRDDGRGCDESAGRLREWLEQHGIRLAVMAECGTAAHTNPL